MAAFWDKLRKKTECVFLEALQGPQAERYRRFKNFLRHNQGALSALAELEQAFYSGKPFTLACARWLYDDLLESMHGVAWSLEAMTGEDSAPLVALVESLDRQVWDELNPALAFTSDELVIPFPRLTAEQRGLVGSKAANLAAMKNDLDLPAPEGFAITAAAFELFLHVNDLEEFIEKEVAAISLDSPRSLEIASARIRQQVIFHSQVPASVESQVLEAYQELEAVTRPGVRVAMRSSAIGEDTEASFAGQYSTELNVTKEGLLLAYQAVLASKYSPRALAYRLHRGLDDRETPMSVACVAMVDSLASGVMYTADPSDPDSGLLKINAIWGLGEHLVDGSASPDVYMVSRSSREITERAISAKATRLVNLPEGGIGEEAVPQGQRDQPAVGDELVRRLAGYGLALDEHYGGPQDVEWALDQEGRLLLLQCRPLEVAEKAQEAGDLPREYPGFPVLLSGGKAACQGVAVGEVFLARGGEDLYQAPKGAILVAPTASPAYARLMGQIGGLVSDVGSVTSHLASVAREFGVPALVDAKEATARLVPGQVVTLWASAGLVYQGVVEELLREARAVKNLMVESPVHRRLRRVLDLAAPLTLTDPEAPSFNPAGCQTLHDVVRYGHEQAMRGMFGLARLGGGDLPTVRLTTTVPMIVQLIDVGGGLKAGLTTCDAINADHLESTPMRAIWRGISHPGINWTSAVAVNFSSMMSLMASSTTGANQGLGSASYAVISRDYLNFSARFGYHFATIDCLCGENPDQNYFSLQFAGGAGDYRGRALRIQFLANVMGRLGLTVSLKGDLLEASLVGQDCPSMEATLDQVGRLLGCSRLLDVGLANRGALERLSESFFQGEYDFLSGPRDEALKDFYVVVGDWSTGEEDGRPCYLQDGSVWVTGLSTGLAGLATRFVGEKYYEFLDNVEAYYYFPMMIRKDSHLADGAAEVEVKAVGGSIDRAGGLVFGLKDAGNFFVLRLNALENNLILFEFVNAKRLQRASVKRPINSDRWYRLRVEVEGRAIKGYLDDELCLEHQTSAPAAGFVGLWTKADSVTSFRELHYQPK